MNKLSNLHAGMGLICLALMLAARPAAMAQGVVHSHPPTNGVYAEIAMTTVEAAVSTDKIRYCFLTTNEFGAKIAYPKPQYFCRMGLQDSRGSNVPPTALCRAMGNEFPGLNTFSPEKLAITERRGSSRAGPRTEGIYSGS
jgi:hypothetical protein